MTGNKRRSTARTSARTLEDSVRKIEFGQLLEEAGGSTPLERFVLDLGVVYVTAITRDGCSGCEEQKPLFEKLARKLSAGRPRRAQFLSIHIHYSERDQVESARGKRVLGYAAYPTYMIHVRSRYGVLELYRAIYPSMEELEKQVAASLDLADYYRKDAEKVEQRVPANAQLAAFGAKSAHRARQAQSSFQDLELF